MKLKMTVALALVCALLLGGCMSVTKSGTPAAPAIPEVTGQVLDIPTEAPTTAAPTEEPTEAPTTEAPTEEPTTEAPTQTFVPVAPGSYVEYKDSTPPAYQANQVNVAAKHVYWDGQYLIAECYIVNGLSSTVSNLKLTDLSFYDQNENLIASGNFGVLQGLTIAPYGTATWNFRFLPDTIFQYGVNLSPLKWHYNIGYDY